MRIDLGAIAREARLFAAAPSIHASVVLPNPVESTAWFHTWSFMLRPTNQRNRRLRSNCSTSCRSELTGITHATITRAAHTWKRSMDQQMPISANRKNR